MDTTHHAHGSIVAWMILLSGLFSVLSISACREGTHTEAAIAGGRANFQAYCASCHGREGTGDGPVAEKLQTRPPDLTLLSKKFDGEFPLEYVVRTIDGEEELMAHGSRTMPVWGRIWRSEGDPESDVEAQRILTELIEYLQSIQQDA